MKNSKSYKYKNYGPIPQNEYGVNNIEKNTVSADPLEGNPQADDKEYRQRLIKRQALHPSGLKKSCGWAHTWKTNGWRSESASQDDEFTDTESYSHYVKRSRPLTRDDTACTQHSGCDAGKDFGKTK